MASRVKRNSFMSPTLALFVAPPSDNDELLGLEDELGEITSQMEMMAARKVEIKQRMNEILEERKKAARDIVERAKAELAEVERQSALLMGRIKEEDGPGSSDELQLASEVATTATDSIKSIKDTPLASVKVDTARAQSSSPSAGLPMSPMSPTSPSTATHTFSIHNLHTAFEKYTHEIISLRTGPKKNTYLPWPLFDPNTTLKVTKDYDRVRKSSDKAMVSLVREFTTLYIGRDSANWDIQKDRLRQMKEDWDYVWDQVGDRVLDRYRVMLVLYSLSTLPDDRLSSTNPRASIAA